MKLIAVLILLSPFFLNAQVEGKKGDNTITLSGSHSINELARYLVLAGYEIEMKDEVLKYITTKPIQTKSKSASTYRIKAVFGDNVMIVTGLVQLNTPYKKDRSKHKYLEEKAYVTSLPSNFKDAFSAILKNVIEYAKERGGEVKTEKR